MQRALANGLGYVAIGILGLGCTACGLGALYLTYSSVRLMIEGDILGGLIFIFVGVPALTAFGSIVVGAAAAGLGGIAESLRPKESPQDLSSRESREHWEALLPEGLPDGFEFDSNGWPVGPDGEPIPRDP